jgi:hypothetical protein
MGMLSSHPNIVTIFDAGLTNDGKPYLIMEFMPEGSLDDRVEAEGPLGWDEVAEIGVKLAGALHTAHAATVLHRDVKPANVLRSSFGEPCLSDFGLARFGGQAKTTGVVTATLLHAPPEILAGQPASPQSDVYSLGSSLHTLLRGDAPFWLATDESILPLISRISDAPVPDLRPRGVPSELCAAIEMALAKDPADRPESAAAFGELLRDAQVAAGMPATTLPLAGQASVRAAREVASAPTDPNLTVGRVQQADDPNATIARGKAPTADDQVVAAVTEAREPAPAPERKQRRRWPLVLAALVVVAALAVGAVLVLGGGDDADPGEAVGASDPGGSSSGNPTTPAQLRRAANQLFDRLNELRDDQGLPRVEPDADLTTEANDQAIANAESGLFLDIHRDALFAEHPNQWSQVFATKTRGTTPDDAFDNGVADQLEESVFDDSADVAGIGLALAGDGTYWLEVFLGTSV